MPRVEWIGPKNFLEKVQPAVKGRQARVRLKLPKWKLIFYLNVFTICLSSVPSVWGAGWFCANFWFLIHRNSSFETTNNLSYKFEKLQIWIFLNLFFREDSSLTISYTNRRFVDKRFKRSEPSKTFHGEWSEAFNFLDTPDEKLRREHMVCIWYRNLWSLEQEWKHLSRRHCNSLSNGFSKILLRHLSS